MKVFLCETIHPEAYRLLAEHAEILPSWEMCGEADALINRALMIGPAEMDRMPNLRVIAVHGTGTDGVDLAEAKKRYGWRTKEAGKASDCIKCGACEGSCPQHLPIRELLEEIAGVLE